MSEDELLAELRTVGADEWERPSPKWNGMTIPDWADLVGTAAVVRWPLDATGGGRAVAGKEELIGEVLRAEARLSRLETELREARGRLNELRAELAVQGQPEPGTGVPLPGAAPRPEPRSPQD